MSADAPSATKEVQAKFGPVVQLQRSNVSLRQMRMQRSSSKGTITHVEIPFGSVSLGSKPLRKSSFGVWYEGVWCQAKVLVCMVREMP